MADCVFCGIVAGDVPAFKVADEPSGLAFLDTRPVFKGHVLVVPRPHIVQLTELPADLIGGYFGLVQRLSAAVPAALGTTGTFVAMNNLVSQSVPHLHTHVVPRTKGDGLRGFFWPRHKYAGDEEAAEFAENIGKEYRRLGVTDSGRRE
ncbi:histidine triad (HIT) family protein [Actinoplanes octamycinicus]|uniref:Histidine triad (HIT) family protein n=1 Tax=Actinoplanes octamycinicus TaxID=135948 RepID=A0A7W7GVB7_9ACTN|nr:HIT family protein [Actinoplanes octamycinicus]MBB4739010.1 histidine triad (HIT) family protein [Actinoplanes octamycinicus]GIE60140.1 hydrolase [Actinoplanes octamycinicus]